MSNLSPELSRYSVVLGPEYCFLLMELSFFILSTPMHRSSANLTFLLYSSANLPEAVRFHLLGLLVPLFRLALKMLLDC